ncbi:hypothetical protein GMLC_39960 [Geomonas limicola]|uniref:PABS domain-containing protein n=1 Tax=Geomonas limicola TaxID=2740186 RepID=A0A6V8NF57_9BACT|nr:fused MFS/spermidine synthase [Geomonas limicola]GFO70417.1 hypothetical protein GMLC_39960 [Geomonas limicola]
MSINRRHIFFLLFGLSGFSGLIYESIWTHYLKLFLGHAAYAQTLVLAIFMGGMAIGSWICSTYSASWKNLLLGYAVTEGVVGFCALLFHPAFTRIIDAAYTTMIPAIGEPVAVSVFKWTLSALMILPQSILLGMTFPLMSAGILRRFPDRPGRSIAFLYFTNSIGAAFGVLLSGFVLIRWIGLPGTICLAGAINIALALVVCFLVKGPSSTSENVESETLPAGEPKAGGWYRLFLLVSLLTGTASFIYEIGWIRMLSLVLGTSTHAFELMLSAFIFGLAFGGLWIQRRIDQVGRPARYLACVQVAMGILALSTLLLYGNTFEVMQWIVKSLPKNDLGYGLFNLSGSAIAMAIMFPATFCAGMTLPLITFVLLRQGHGERSIGAVYAANTVGAIIGVFFAIHLGLPLFGLKGLISFGAGLDILVGVVLFWGAADSGDRRQAVGFTAAGGAALSITLLFVNLDPYKMASGVYRYGTLLNRQNTKLVSYQDGKTASISVVRDGDGSMSVNTNGKTDASIMMQGQGATSDESTMILLAALPMSLNPGARTAASIGMGSGMTSHALLGNPRLQQVDTIEIENRMVEAARLFRPAVERVFNDTRSKIYIDDAKTYFSSYNKSYDLIVSEPSNPWVSGVAGLFSEEFYRLIKHHMTDDGVFVQWVQLYEINTDLVVSVLKAVSNEFSDFAVYAPNDFDIVIISKKRGLLGEPDQEILNLPALRSALSKNSIHGAQDIAVRKIGTKKFLGNFLVNHPCRANSDYYPFVDQNAAKTRFLSSSATELLQLPRAPLPTLDMLQGEPKPWRETKVTPAVYSHSSQAAFAAMALRDFFLVGDFHDRYNIVPDQVKQDALQVKRLFTVCGANPNQQLGALFATAIRMIPYLTPEELDSVWAGLESGPCTSSLAPSTKAFVSLFKVTGRRDARTMSTNASALLQNADGMTQGTVKYLLASAMLGALACGDIATSEALWSKFRVGAFGGTEPDLLYRLLTTYRAPR